MDERQKEKEERKMKKYHVAIYYTGACDFVIAEARRFTEEEKTKYVEAFRERGFVTCGEHLRMEGLHWADCPSRRTDGEVVGSSNFTWIITEEEKAKYIELNKKKLEQERKKDIEEQIKYWQEIIAKAEAQKCIPTKEQKKAMLKEYIDTYNEGGEGYVPQIISIETYNNAHEMLSSLLKKMETEQEAL